MANNYQDDCLPQGAGNDNFYSLWHWEGTTCFVYFSHHLVSIPPQGWIHSAHRHGVKVLGTFITEWAAGAAICGRIFSDHITAQCVADQLVELAQVFGFEGWLINIENQLTWAQVAVLKHFLGYLRARLREVVPHGMVIWYDAVTTWGYLHWQNSVTPLNEPFFDASDAIFINYVWQGHTPSNVRRRVTGRAGDVYMGVDVFGRNTYGGGGDNCNVALSAAKAEGLSAALFAPGWVYECEDKSRWHDKQEQFWGKVLDSWTRPRCPHVCLPFATTFNWGQGRALWENGRKISSQPWFNMSVMSPLPLRPSGHSKPMSSSLNWQLTKLVGYTGGSCLEISDDDHGVTGVQDCSLGVLFSTSLVIPPSGVEIRYASATFPGKSLYLVLWVAQSGPGGDPPAWTHRAPDILLIDGDRQGDLPAVLTESTVICPEKSCTGVAVQPWSSSSDLGKSVEQKTGGGPHKLEGQPLAGTSSSEGLLCDVHWCTRHFHLDKHWSGCRITGVGLALLVNQPNGGAPADPAVTWAPAHSHAFLGEVVVTEAGGDQGAPGDVEDLMICELNVANTGVLEGQEVVGEEQLNTAGSVLNTTSRLLDCTLTWNVPAQGPPPVYYLVWWRSAGGGSAPEGLGFQWLGYSCGCRYRVAGLVLPVSCNLVEFQVQAVSSAYVHTGQGSTVRWKLTDN